MTEPILLTAIIASSVVAILWIIIHYAYKLQADDRQQKAGHGSVQFQIGGDAFNPPPAEELLAAARRRHLDLN